MPLCPGKISFLTRWIGTKLSPGFGIHLNPSKTPWKPKMLAAGNSDTSSHIFTLPRTRNLYRENSDKSLSLSLSLSLSSNLQAKFKKESFCGRILSSHLPPPCLPIQKPISTTAIPSTPLKPCLRQPDSSKLSLVLNPQKKQPKPQPFAQIPGSRKTAGADPKIKSTATDTFQAPQAS